MFTMISFSGGRSSAMMTKILCENIPEDKRIICFANTGKEHELTLKFVHDYEVHFSEKIHWIEYCEVNGYKLVEYETASRQGEPYAALIKKRGFLPNPVTRFCTTELKIRPIKKFIQSLGYKEWENAVGIRYDEPSRYARLPKGCAKEPYETIAPLYHLRVNKADVLKFWESQTFNLEIPEYLGNCDMCFLKARSKLKHIIKTEPKIVEWWIQQENQTGSTFRNNISYKKLVFAVKVMPELFDDDTEIDCLCTID
ncbi:MAG: Nin-like protein [Caulobacteraceae bacterium]|nr:Nin-like protein [Caulobacteraceae bacterium]